jgi:4-hydroxy-4-methyl-2-oxoglutarate aldolase
LPTKISLCSRAIGRRQSIARWKVNGWQVPVSILGDTSQCVTVRTGDFMLGDEDDVLVIPNEVVEAEQLTKSSNGSVR